MTKQESEPTCLCGGVGSMMRITDKAMVKCTLCKGTGVRIAETRGGVMATVDLAKLEQEIVDLGSVMTSGVDDDWLDVELEVTKFRVSRDGYICENDGTDMTGIVLALARHVTPVAPDPALREAIAEAVRTCDLPVGGGFDATGHLTDRDCAVIADTVLAVLAERGMA